MDILNEEFVNTDMAIKFTEDWYAVVVQVPMTEDIKKIVCMFCVLLPVVVAPQLTCNMFYPAFVAKEISMSNRLLTANDMNRRYEAEIPAQLAAPGTISGQEKVNGFKRDSSCTSS